MVGAGEEHVADEPPARRRNPWNGVLAALCFVALIAAGALGLWSRARFSDGVTARHEAAASDAERVDLARRAADDDQRRRDLNAAAADVATALDAYTDALTTAADDQNKLVDVQDRSVDQYNTGHPGAAVDLLKNEGDPLLADLTQRVDSVGQRITDIETKIQALQAALDG